MLAATRPTMLRTLPPMAAAITLLCAPGYAETLDELYAKAKNEKSLVIYAGGPISNYEPLAREFERKFPGLTVSIEGGFSNVLNTLYLFHTLAQKYGADYIDKYLANGPNWVQGHLSVSRSVAAGTNLVTLDATTSTVLNLKKAGQPIDFVFSDVDPLPVYYSTAGIFKDAPHPNVAKLYLTWVLAPEQQSRIGTFSSRNDVPPPAGLKPLFSYTVANDYRGFVTNERLLADLRQRFEAAVGPIRNAGGVR